MSDLTTLKWLSPLSHPSSDEVLKGQSVTLISAINDLDKVDDSSEHSTTVTPLTTQIPIVIADEEVSTVSTTPVAVSMRPSCSYSCLIAMALKACTSKCLPVSEIYRFIEKEYPFFKTAPDGWKNSIRHNLSLNNSFCKAERPDGLQMKKGCYWMVNPERQHFVDAEVEKFLTQTGRKLVENGELLRPVSNTSFTATVAKQPRCSNLNSRQIAWKQTASQFQQSQPPSISTANFQKINSIFGFETESFPVDKLPAQAMVNPISCSEHNSTLDSMNGAMQELFNINLTPSLLRSLDDSSIAFFSNATSSKSTSETQFRDHFDHFTTSHEETLYRTKNLEKWLANDSLSTASSYSAPSSESSLTDVNRIIANIAQNRPIIAVLSDDEYEEDSEPPATSKVDEMLCKFVEKKLNQEFTVNNEGNDYSDVIWKDKDEKALAMCSPFTPAEMSQYYQFTSLLCDDEDSDMEDSFTLMDNGIESFFKKTPLTDLLQESTDLESFAADTEDPMDQS